MAWWPFNRRAKPNPPGAVPPVDGDSVEDWAVGDIAECLVARGGWGFRTPFGLFPMIGPGEGDTERVVAVTIVDGAQFLTFTRYGPQHTYHAIHFRKITPKADALERADADFIQTIKPKVPTI